MKYFFLISLISMSCLSCQLHERQVLHFEKLIYHSSQFGPGPFIDLEIDSNATVIASRSFVVLKTKMDSLTAGNFIGSLSQEDYSHLMNLLESADITTLKFPPVFCCDRVITTIIVYYNHKRKYLRSMEHPGKADELVEFLLKVGKDYPFTKTTEIHEIEDEFH